MIKQFKNRLKPLKAMVLLAAGLAVLSGCRTRPAAEFKSVAPGEPFAALSAKEDDPVVLRPGVLFSVHVEVDGREEIEAESLRVQDTGEVVLPILGTVGLGAMTLEQAAKELVACYSSYYNSTPIVRLQFEEDPSGQSSPWGFVTVFGRVSKPGRVSLPPTRDMTVSGAIQRADGFDTSANLSSVTITRIGDAGHRNKVVVDMNRIGSLGDADQDIHLKAGDIVYVPESIF